MVEPGLALASCTAPRSVQLLFPGSPSQTVTTVSSVRSTTYVAAGRARAAGAADKPSPARARLRAMNSEASERSLIGDIVVSCGIGLAWVLADKPNAGRSLHRFQIQEVHHGEIRFG